MHSKFIVIFILVSLLVLAGCKEETESYYSQQKFNINGMLDEWTDHPLLTIEGQPVSLGIRNDDNNLYLMLATRSEQMVRTFQNHGLTLWLNANNKKKKDFGIVIYPDFDLPEREEQNIMEHRISSDMLAKMKQRREEMRGKIEIIIKSNRITLTSDESSVATGFAFYKSVYLIEIKISFGPYDLIDNSYTFQPESIFSVGFISGMRRDRMKEMMDSNTRYGNRGGNSGYTGGIDNPGGTWDMSEHDKIRFNKLELWLSIKLAKSDIF